MVPSTWREIDAVTQYMNPFRLHLRTTPRQILYQQTAHNYFSEGGIMKKRLPHVLRVLLMLVGIPLSGCSMGEAINHQVFDYYQVNDLASNQIILLNVLYARDGAPLHFSELSQIRGSLSANVSASTVFPFGPISHATVAPRSLGTLGATVSSSPSFDIASLDTKDFTAGVMAPITGQEAEFFLNEGIDYRMVLMLFASGIRPTNSPEMVLNAPNDSRKVCIGAPHAAGSNAELTNFRIVTSIESCETPFSEFFAFLDIVNHIGRLYPVSVMRPPKPMGPPFTLTMNTNLRAITGIDPTKYMLRRLPSGQYQLMTTPHSSLVILCEATPTSARVVSVLSDSDDTPARVRADACTTHRGFDDDEVGTDPRPATMVTIGVTPGTFNLKLRSTLEIIQYIGQILAFQEAETVKFPSYPERCVTLQFIPHDSSHRTCEGGVLIRLLNTTGTSSPSDVNVLYNGQRWSLPAPHTCTDPEHCDHSSETMSIISLLLNRNKSAKDIVSTPAVEVVP